MYSLPYIFLGTQNPQAWISSFSESLSRGYATPSFSANFLWLSAESGLTPATAHFNPSNSDSLSEKSLTSLVHPEVLFLL